MTLGICHLSVIPVRAEPSDSAEMVSQVLFGEFVLIVKTSGNWLQIRTLHDDYTGWVDAKQIGKTTQAFIDGATDNSSVSLELAQSATSSTQHIPLLLGSSLPYFDGMNFRINKEKFVFNGQAVMPGQNGKSVVIEKVVNKLLNAPYLWGGRSPFGMDCSGFTQVVFKTLGIRIPRDCVQQAECGETISFISAARTGDIAFFQNKQGRMAHAGIVISEGKIAHAYGQVRIDSIDHEGIFNNDSKSYTHKLRLIKRLF